MTTFNATKTQWQADVLELHPAQTVELIKRGADWSLYVA